MNKKLELMAVPGPNTIIGVSRRGRLEIPKGKYAVAYIGRAINSLDLIAVTSMIFSTQKEADRQASSMVFHDIYSADTTPGTSVDEMERKATKESECWLKKCEVERESIEQDIRSLLTTVSEDPFDEAGIIDLELSAEVF